MAYSIIEGCVKCHACAPLCPSQAIYETAAYFKVDTSKCAECAGDYADPQCASICPIEGAIVNGLGEPANPPGSLTGFPPARMAAARAEIQAR